MDMFGITNAIKVMLRGYSLGSRASGRTTYLLAQLKDGDTVLCSCIGETEHLRQLVHAKGLIVDVKCLPPTEPTSVMDRMHRYAKGRVLFDHGWVEAFYADQFDSAAKQLETLILMGNGMKESPPRPMHRWVD